MGEPIVLAALAVLCDKYDFSKAIVSWGSIWLQKWTKNTSAQDLSYLLILAYILGLTESFAEISVAIIMSHVGVFSSLPFNDHVLIRNGLAGMLQAAS